MKITSKKILFSMFVLGGFITTVNAAEFSPSGDQFVRIEDDDNMNEKHVVPQQNTKGITKGWHHSYDTAIAEAKKTGKPVLLHFYADWCGPCQQMEQNVLNTSTVTNLLGSKIIAAKINIDQHPELKGRFGVSSYPSDVFIKADGSVISQSSGKMDADSYASTIASIAGKHSVAAQRKTTQRKEEKKITVVSREVKKSDLTVGLKGFSPVSLAMDEKWIRGSKKFAWNYSGVVYHMSNQKELEQFKSNPAQYAPKLGGCDPTISSGYDQRVVPGKIQHTVFFNEGVYLFKSKQNLDRFMQSPMKYAVQDQVVEAPVFDTVIQ